MRKKVHLSGPSASAVSATRNPAFQDGSRGDAQGRTVSSPAKSIPCMGSLAAAVDLLYGKTAGAKKHSLLVLLRQIHSGAMVLPFFQGRFLWPPETVEAFIGSIARGEETGVIVRVKTAERRFDCRMLDGAPLHATSRPRYVLIDGQQRLTSLYQVFFGTGQYRYYVSLSKIARCPDIDRAVFHRPFHSDDRQKMDCFREYADEHIVPLGILGDGPSAFDRWSRTVIRMHLCRNLDDLSYLGKWIRTIFDYSFPVIDHAGKKAEDALCSIAQSVQQPDVTASILEMLEAGMVLRNGCKSR